MSKIVIIAVFIFWSAVSIFYANSLFRPDKATSNNLQNNQQPINTDNTQLSTLGVELASHNSQDNCWLAVNGKVYDVTKYIYTHPGGAGEIIKYCGQEATQAFATMDKARPRDHSQSAYKLLENYYIGELNSASASANNPSNANLTDNTTSGTNTNTNNVAVNIPKPTSLTLTSAMVSQHNTAGDCWVTAGANVYNVTSYIRSHPGGQSNITKYCGADIAVAFAGQGHSAKASNIFANYKIGTIGSSFSTDVVTTPPTNTNQNIGNNEYEEEEEDD